MERAVRMLVACALSLAAGGCAVPVRTAGAAAPEPAEAAAAPGGDRPVDLLAAWMTGQFSNARQHAAEPDGWAAMTLRQMPIWTARSDGPWLYSAFAGADTPDRPIRSCVYRLLPADDGEIECQEFVLPPGAPTDTGLALLGPADLEPRTGCELRLARELGVFAGATRGQACASLRGGAAYERRELVVGPGTIMVLDQGFAADGRQVWGRTEGGYRFERQTRQ